MSTRGNPDWGKPYVPVPFLHPEFEQQVEKLGLRPDEYRTSSQLRNWCLRNAKLRYVPEHLLKLWGIHVNDSWAQPIAEYVVSTRRQ